MRQALIFFIIFSLAQSCRSPEYFRFAQPSPANSGNVLSETDDGNNQTNLIDTLEADTLSYFDKGEKKEILYSPEFKAKNFGQSRRTNPDAIPIKPVVIEATKRDSVNVEDKLGPLRKPNTLSFVSFFSGVALLILLLFPYYVAFSSSILLSALVVTAIITGKIALKQIVKRHESGRALALFGLSIGSLLIFLFLFAMAAKLLAG